MAYRENVNRQQVREIVETLDGEYGIDETYDRSYPQKPNLKGSQVQVLWSLYVEGRIDTIKGLRENHRRWIEVAKPPQR